MTLRSGRALGAFLLSGALLLSACDNPLSDDGPAPTPAQSPSAATTIEPYDSQFTRDGTFQSHIERKKLDFVYTLYPTKSTPRTNEWYPKGSKYFSFTFQAYDLSRRIRDPFATKRLVYLDRIKVTSRTVNSDESPTEHPYSLNAVAQDVTFDPEPLATRYGMLITSPKGAFELRNQRIRGTAADTRGLVLTFSATVYAETSAGSGRFARQVITQSVPIAIFASDKTTVATKIPVDAN